jgi:hypothetical protein
MTREPPQAVSNAESAVSTLSGPQTAVPLTGAERVRLGHLERTIERGLSRFMEVGRCLAEIRAGRLYREKYPDFQSYCRERFALARSTCDQMIRSTATAELLLSKGVELSLDTQEAVIRPVSALPSAELQVQAWRLVQAVSPQCGPTQPVASKVCRVIKNALEPEQSNGSGHKPRRREHTERETPFLRPVQRLAKYKGFDAGLVISHVEKLPRAWSVYAACEEMIDRCRKVQERLVQRFPELHG